ncbi:MAG: hypothetical protein CL885_04560 [Dehalococcoidia bacterium]|nr:hypothetical protein [Dehalococcoidia bacterium]
MKSILYTGVLFLISCSDYDLKSMDKSELPGRDTGTTVIDSGTIPDTSTPIETADPEPEPELPIAICDVDPNPVSPPFESATWVGNNSYDPSGGTITDYSWELLSLPGGSTSTMPVGTANRYPFTPDMAGDYVGQLIVTNDVGDVSEPCQVTLSSTPAENLWVEMYWEFPNDDMDLHLVSPGGTYNNYATDCYYANCTPELEWFYDMDWGVSGYEGDDPSLDLDDINNTGPENINILDPQTDGVYTVIVHDYQGSTPDVYGANQVTVNIYLNGTMAWTDTRVISGDNTVNEFAEIDWSTGTVNSL